MRITPSCMAGAGGLEEQEQCVLHRATTQHQRRGAVQHEISINLEEPLGWVAPDKGLMPCSYSYVDRHQMDGGKKAKPGPVDARSSLSRLCAIHQSDGKLTPSQYGRWTFHAPSNSGGAP